MVVGDLIKVLQKVDKDLPLVVSNPGRYDFSDVEYEIVTFELENDGKIVNVASLRRVIHDGY